MAISINWGTQVIYVPKADLTLIQPSPEIRQIDLDWFRYQLKALEESEEGMPFLDTHNHNTEVELAGLTYARIVEIINGYTVEFEDGQYTVNCVGANHNLSDVKVANQVSLIVNNAAGLINNAQIEYASFNGGVAVDTQNGSSGTLFPQGTPQAKVNNWSDALIIAAYRGFERFYVYGDAEVDGSNDFSDMEIIGQSPNKTTLTINALSQTQGLELKNATVTGTLDGENFIMDSTVIDLTYVNGSIVNCGLIGDIVLDGDRDAVINDCFTIDQDDPPIIDMGGSGQSLAMPNYSGLLTLKNLSDPNQEVGVGLNAGMVILDSTITAGTVIISGVGVVQDNSTGDTIVNIDGLMSKETINRVNWDTVWVDTSTSSTGTSFPAGTKEYPVNNMTDGLLIADENNIEKIHIHGNVSLPGSAAGMILESHSHDSGIIDFNGQDVTGVAVKKMTISGAGTGHINLDGCYLPNGYTGISGHLDNCILSGAYTIAAGETLNADRCTCPSATTFDMNGTGSLGFANFSGIMSISNATDPACTLSVTGYYLLTLASSLTAGNAYIAGTGILINNSAGMTITERTLPAKVADEVWAYTDAQFLLKIIKNKKALQKTGSVWELIIYDDDDTTPILQKDLKDIDGNNITDIIAGNLAQELATSV